MEQLLAILPLLLILLACPLMMMFMMRGAHGSDHRDHEVSDVHDDPAQTESRRIAELERDLAQLKSMKHVDLHNEHLQEGKFDKREAER